MIDFEIKNDTKLLLRNNPIEELTGIIRSKKVLFVYGEGSVYKNGCYNDIKQAAENGNCQLFEFGNASYEFSVIEKGIQYAKEKSVELVIGAGGASVMDASKLISFGYYHDGVWDYVKQKKDPTGLQHLPIVLIPTYPSSGSEYASGAVSIDSRTKDFGVALGITANYGILVPKYTVTLNPELTAYSCFVTFVQLSTTVLGDNNPISYDEGISVIKNVLKAAEKLKDNPADLNARGVILYAASISVADRIGLGKTDHYSFDLYQIEYVPEVLFGSSYRKGLTTLFPRFLKTVSKKHEDDVRLYFKNVFNFSGTIDESINKLIQIFVDYGIDMYFQGEVSKEKIQEVPVIFPTQLNNDEIYDMIKNCMK